MWRVLVCSPLGEVIKPPLMAGLRRADRRALVEVATDPAKVRSVVASNPRFDVALVDILWNDSRYEARFDGLDAVEVLHKRGAEGIGVPPIVFARQGHSAERDHLHEAIERGILAGVVQKGASLESLLAAVTTALDRGRLADQPAAPRHTLHAWFTTHPNAARMAGAIAAGRATDAATLAKICAVSSFTAHRVSSEHLGPLIRDRKEIAPDQKLTVQVVYRWCGEHRHYIVSWCRRNGLAELVTVPSPGPDGAARTGG